MENKHWILNEQGDPEITDLMTWARWFESAPDRVVAFDEVSPTVSVSTVFLGLDHSFGGSVPVLWETMIFGGPHDGYQERYTSRIEAVAGHQTALDLARQ